MIKPTVMLLALFAGVSPLSAEETQADSTRSKRPVFSMTPT